MRKLLLLVLVSCLALQLPVSAQVPPAGTPDLATGIRQVEEGDLEAAVVTLDVVIQRLKSQKGREQDLATAHIYLAMAHLGLSQWERAKGEMREAWRNNQKLALDPKKFPPRVIQLYEEAKQETQKAQVGAPKATPAPPPPPAPVTTAAKKGGSKTTPILIGVGVAAAAGIGIGVAGGKGAAPAPTPAPAPQPTPAPTPVPLSTVVIKTWAAPENLFVVDFVAAQPAPGSTVPGYRDTSSFPFSVGLIVRNPSDVDASQCTMYAHLKTDQQWCARFRTASPFDLRHGGSVELVVATPNHITTCATPIDITEMATSCDCRVPQSSNMESEERWRVNYRITP